MVWELSTMLRIQWNHLSYLLQNSFTYQESWLTRLYTVWVTQTEIWGIRCNCCETSTRKMKETCWEYQTCIPLASVVARACVSRKSGSMLSKTSDARWPNYQQFRRPSRKQITTTRLNPLMQEFTYYLETVRKNCEPLTEIAEELTNLINVYIMISL
jgi:hypothetical protein